MPFLRRLSARRSEWKMVKKEAPELEKPLSCEQLKSFYVLWCETGSNRRHKDFKQRSVGPKPRVIQTIVGSFRLFFVHSIGFIETRYELCGAQWSPAQQFSIVNQGQSDAATNLYEPLPAVLVPGLRTFLCVF